MQLINVDDGISTACTIVLPILHFASSPKFNPVSCTSAPPLVVPLEGKTLNISASFPSMYSKSGPSVVTSLPKETVSFTTPALLAGAMHLSSEVEMDVATADAVPNLHNTVPSPLKPLTTTVTFALPKCPPRLGFTACTNSIAKARNSCHQVANSMLFAVTPTL